MKSLMIEVTLMFSVISQDLFMSVLVHVISNKMGQLTLACGKQIESGTTGRDSRYGETSPGDRGHVFSQFDLHAIKTHQMLHIWPYLSTLSTLSCGYTLVKLCLFKIFF